MLSLSWLHFYVAIVPDAQARGPIASPIRDTFGPLVIIPQKHIRCTFCLRERTYHVWGLPQPSLRIYLFFSFPFFFLFIASFFQLNGRSDKAITCLQWLHISLMILWSMNRQRKPHAVSMSKTRSGKRLPVLHLQKTPLLHSRIHWLLNFQI